MASQGTTKGKAKGKKGLIVLVIGLVLLILGIVWIGVLWPTLNKLPVPYEETLYLDGNITAPDPANPQQMVTFSVKETLQQNGDQTQDGAVFMHEKYTMNNAITGEEITAHSREQTLAVDRKTLEIVTDIDEQHRSGCWGPPRGLGEGDTFEFWNVGAHQYLTANYVKDDTFRDMKVVIFQIDEKDISLGNYSNTQLPLLMDVSMTLTIHPKTGAVVNEESRTTISLMAGQKQTVKIVSLHYSEETIVDIMDAAKDGSKMLTLMGTVLPWTLIGVGAVLLIVGIVWHRRIRGQ